MYIDSKIILQSKFVTRLIFEIYRKRDKLISTQRKKRAHLCHSNT